MTPRVVWNRKHIAADLLEEDSDAIPAHLTVESHASGSDEITLKAEALDVEVDRRLQILDDEEWTDRLESARRAARLLIVTPEEREDIPIQNDAPR